MIIRLILAGTRRRGGGGAGGGGFERQPQSKGLFLVSRKTVFFDKCNKCNSINANNEVLSDVQISVIPFNIAHELNFGLFTPPAVSHVLFLSFFPHMYILWFCCLGAGLKR